MQAVLVLLLLAAGTTTEPEWTDETVKAIEAVNASAQLTVKAKQVTREPPKFPKTELRKGREAWVHVTYCIDESGQVTNISILDSIGNEKFDRAAIETVENWQFEPALHNGEPVWQSRNNVLVTFAIEFDERGATSKFIRSYRKLQKLMDEDNLPEADALFWEMYENFDLNLYELAKLWSQRVRYEAKIGDWNKLEMALYRATASHGEWIEKSSYAQLLQLRIKVELQLGKYHEARHSYEDLAGVVGEDSQDVLALRPAFARLETMIDGDDVLKVDAEIRRRGECTYCNDSWTITPLRKHFTLANIKGTLSSIEMRCDNKRYESDVTEMVEWHIPDSWGTCRVHIYGEPGTTFEMLMLPVALN